LSNVKDEYIDSVVTLSGRTSRRNTEMSLLGWPMEARGQQCLTLRMPTDLTM
jgi:hypothetical protein